MEIIKAEIAVGKLHTKRAVWRLELETELSSQAIEKAFDGAMVVTKRGKSGEKQVDISPMTKFISVTVENNLAVLRVELNAAGNDYLNPSYVAAFFGDKVKLKRTVRENIIF